MASTYGWTHQEIINLKARQFFLYLRQVFKMKSVDQLKNFEASLIPHMKESDRTDLFMRYQEITVPAKVSTKDVEDAWSSLRCGQGRGIL